MQRTYDNKGEETHRGPAFFTFPFLDGLITSGIVIEPPISFLSGDVNVRTPEVSRYSSIIEVWDGKFGSVLIGARW